MDDIIGKILSTIFIIIFMIVFPLILILQNNDKLVQRYADEAVESFKNTCLVSGQITEENYQNLITELNNTGYVFKIKLEEYDESFYMTNDGQYQFTYSGHDGQTILETVCTGIRDEHQYFGQPYLMSNGSYLKITVETDDSTFATKLASIATLGAIKSTGIHSIDGGRVQANGIDF